MRFCDRKVNIISTFERQSNLPSRNVNVDVNHVQRYVDVNTYNLPGFRVRNGFSKIIKLVRKFDLTMKMI